MSLSVAIPTPESIDRELYKQGFSLSGTAWKVLVAIGAFRDGFILGTENIIIPLGEEEKPPVCIHHMKRCTE